MASPIDRLIDEACRCVNCGEKPSDCECVPARKYCDFKGCKRRAVVSGIVLDQNAVACEVHQNEYDFCVIESLRKES